MSIAMNTQIATKYTVTASVGPGPAVGADKRETCVLDVCLQAPDGPGRGSVTLVLPKEWFEEAARAQVPTEVKDASVTWTVTSAPESEWVIELSPKPGQAPVAGPWKLSLAVPIKKPAKDTAIVGVKAVLFEANEATLPDIPATATAKAGDPVVRLSSEPPDTTALQYGQPVTLSWTLENIETGTARLRGSFFGARELGAVPGKSLTVWALDHAEYVLEADIMIGTTQHTIQRRVVIDIDRPQFGFRALLRPTTELLPSGPIAVFWTGVNLTRLKFVVQRNLPRSGSVVPVLDKHGKTAGAAESPRNKSFQIQFGPDEQETWTVRADYDTNDPKGLEYNKSVNLPTTPVVAVDITTPPGSRATVRGFTAGRYTRAKAVGSENRSVEWVAVATDEGLDVHFVDVVNQTTVAKTSRPLTGIRGLGVTSVGDREEARTLVVAVADGAARKLQELTLPDLTVTRTDTLPAAFDGAERLHLTSIGDRVYVRGEGIAVSYARSATIEFVDEPWLALLRWPAWEVVAVPGGRGHLYALARRTGTLLRLDQPVDAAGKTVAGPLKEPVEAAAANHRLAKLDLLQRAQLGDAAYLIGKDSRYNLTALASDPSRPFAVDDRGVWDVDAGLIDEQSAVLVLAGAIVVRTTRPDPSRQNTIQGRAYDPRLDVWVRCGTLFPGVKADGCHFACTRSTPRFDANGRPLSTEGSVYCRKPDGTLARVSGELLGLLGFAGMNVTPIAELAPTAARSWRTHTLAAGGELRPGQYLLSPNGQHQLLYQADGDLVLSRFDPRPAPSAELVRTVVWQTNTPGKAGCVRLQANDGNLVVYRAANGTDAAWGGERSGGVIGPAREALDAAAAAQDVARRHEPADEYAGSRLTLSDDGRLELRSRSGILLWRPPRTFVGELPAGELLLRRDSFVSQDRQRSFANSCDWASARLGADGHLRIYGQQTGKPLWTSDTRGGKAAPSGTPRVVVENSGEIAIRSEGATLWSSAWARGSSGRTLEPGQWFESPQGEYRLVLEHDGNLVLYDRDNTRRWSTLAAGSPDFRQLGMVVDDSGDLVAPNWGAHNHGGVWGGPYTGRCAGIKMTANGFQVVSTAPELVWYEVTTDASGALPARGEVRRCVESRACRIYNPDQNGYMFAAGDWRYHKDGNFRGVFVFKGGGADFVDNVWELTEVQAGRFVIYNRHHREWLIASGLVLRVEHTFSDDEHHDRRNIFAVGAHSLVYAPGCGEEGIFELQPNAGSTTIRSVTRDEYVYAADFEMVGQRCRVLSWIPKPNGYGERANHDVWQIQYL